MKKYRVTLTEDERAALGRRVCSGRGPARELARARILLKADRGPAGPTWTDEAIAAALDVSVPTIERVRKRFVEHGVDAAVRQRRPRREYRTRLDGEQEAHLVALACTPPPVGRRRWTLRLLADKLVELRYIDGVSYETVRQVLKKNQLKPWLTKRWCIPPKANGEFVWRMEDILSVYTRPYDPSRPLVCFDEVSKQLIAETRCPRPIQPGRPARYDYEYERNGTANLFLVTEPLRGWRHVEVTERRTKADWARVIKDLVDVRYPDAERIVLCRRRGAQAHRGQAACWASTTLEWPNRVEPQNGDSRSPGGAAIARGTNANCGGGRDRPRPHPPPPSPGLHHESTSRA